MMTEYVRGNDWDLEAAIRENGPSITIDDVAEVLAVVYGEHDQSCYFWVLRLKDGRFGLLDGWHDYTGWDCRSGANWEATATAGAAAMLATEDDNGRPVRAFLLEQLQGVPPEKSGYQTVMARMGFPKVTE